MKLRAGAQRLIEARLGRRAHASDASLGLLERWYAAQTHPRTVVGVLELDRSRTDVEIRDAIQVLHVHHGASIARSVLDTRTWTGPHSAPRLECFEDHERDHLIELAIAEPPGERRSGALYRVLVNPTRKLIVVAFDHTIADGIAARTYLEQLAWTLAGRPPSLEPSGTAPLEARLDVRPSLRELASELLRKDKADFPLGPAHARAHASLRTQVLPFAWAPELVRRVRQRAHAEGVSVHAALVACASRAARDVLRADSHRPIRVETPVSLRELCEPRPHGMGVFVSSVVSDLEREADFWRLARGYARDSASKRGRAHRKVGLLAWVSDLDAMIRSRDARALNLRTATLEVSNVGLMPELPAGTSAWLTQGNHYAGPVFCVTVVRSAEGHLLGCVSVPAPLVDEALTARFVASLCAEAERSAS
jgi:hypothetical protein